MDQSHRLGRKVKCTAASEEPYTALVPLPLPPADLHLEDLHELIDRCNQALGRLDGVATILPNTDWFLYMYVRKEAVLSSQIEGTQSSLSDLLLFESDEAPGVPLDDVQEVSNYVAAMTHGLKRLRGGFPMSLRLVKEIHAVLMAGARGGTKAPGEFRKSQNWIGGSRPGNARYVPPPPESVMDCMSELEKFLHADNKLPMLVTASLMHHQFETIHPFLDGNGRLGRLLITLMLCNAGVLSEPILYLSLYFKQHRQEYYEQLQQVRETGDWEAWIQFFLEGVLEIGTQATNTAKELLSLTQTNRNLISSIGRGAGSAFQVYTYLEKKPLAVVPELTRTLNMTKPTVSAALKNLEDLGIVREITGRQRGRVFVYDALLKILQQGTEPIRQ
jgi:Fic family protein